MGRHHNRRSRAHSESGQQDFKGAFRPITEPGFEAGLASLLHTGFHHRQHPRPAAMSYTRLGPSGAPIVNPEPSLRPTVLVRDSPTDFPRPGQGRNELDLINDMPSYLDIASRKPTYVPSVRPKSRLLVTDLDNTLFAPAASAESSVQPRAFLKTFISYIMHPQSPYQLAVWTFSGRSFGEAHLRTLGLGPLLFDDSDPSRPKRAQGLAAFWGYEDSVQAATERQQGVGPSVKDLSKMWSMINARYARDSPEWSAYNSLLVDDQPGNAACQPNSLIMAPIYTWRSLDDDFLLQLIGVLDELAYSTNFAATLKAKKLYLGIDPVDAAKYTKLGAEVCVRMGVKISRGRTAADAVTRLQVVPLTTSTGPTHDDAEEKKALVKHAPEAHTPSRTARGMTLIPSKLYLREAAEPSRASTIGSPLICFDLDGTLYTRPPHDLEHDPLGQPAGRPYLRSMLHWLLNYSPYHVAIWTGSQKATAVRCLDELDLGIVGPRLVGPNRDEAEILHPKLVAVWAREDLGLTSQDFNSYVAIVKDFDKLWDHLREENIGDWSPYNTVMVDDTISKLRAQPSTLIAAPTFDYPLEPGLAALRSMLDTFLIQLVGMLDELAPQTNFANFIAAERWNEKPTSRSAEFTSAGIRILKECKIPIDAEGRSHIPLSAADDKEARLKRSQANVPKVLKSTSDEPAAPVESASGPRRRAPLTQENLSDVSTDTDTDTDGEDNRFIQEEEEIQQRRKGTKPNRRLSHDQRLRKAVTDWSSDSEEEMEKVRGGGGPRALRTTQRQPFVADKEDWEMLIDDPDEAPMTVHSPYYESRR